MVSRYAQAAEKYLLGSAETANFNETHDLSLVLSPQASAQDARYSLGTIAGSSLVFTELIGYDPARINGRDPELTRRYTTSDESPSREFTPEETIIDNLPYYGLHMHTHWQTDTPLDYEWCRNRLLQVAGADKGHLGYRAELYTGLMDKKALFVPGDATAAQLPEAEYHRVADGQDVPDRIFFTEDIPSKDIYAIIGEVAREHHDMERFRDLALLTNMVRFDENIYREQLGVGQYECLPTYIVRNSRHHDSLTSLLDDNRIKYRLVYLAEPDGAGVGATFAPNVYSKDMHAERVARHITGWAAVSGLDRLDMPEVPKTSHEQAILAQAASQSPRRFAAVRELLIRAKSHPQIFGALKTAANRRAIGRLVKQFQPKA